MQSANRLARAASRISHMSSSVRTSSSIHQQGIRTFTSSSAQHTPAKGSEDRNSLNPVSTEYGMSGGGDQGAAHTKTAFQPGKNDPQEQVESVKQESGSEESNPVRMSPADVDINTRAMDENEYVENSEDQAKGNNTASGGRRQGKQVK